MSSITRELIRRLRLEPHPEGGHFREVYRSSDVVERGGTSRSAVTSIYFLLSEGQHSRWHVVDSDEIWHFYEGDPLELLTYDPGSGVLTRSLLGALATPASTATRAVPRGHWQAARSTGGHSLVGCTVAPGFEFTDFAFVAAIEGHDRAFADVLAPYRSLL